MSVVGLALGGKCSKISETETLLDYIRFGLNKLPSKFKANGASSPRSCTNRWLGPSALPLSAVFFSETAVTNSAENTSRSFVSTNSLSQINGISSWHANRLKHKELFFKLFLLIYTHSRSGSTRWSSHQTSSSPSTNFYPSIIRQDRREKEIYCAIDLSMHPVENTTILHWRMHCEVVDRHEIRIGSTRQYC